MLAICINFYAMLNITVINCFIRVYSPGTMVTVLLEYILITAGAGLVGLM